MTTNREPSEDSAQWRGPRATCELYNINRTRLESLIHRIFGPARLDIEIKDRFGQPVVPREWFLVPLFVINEATRSRALLARNSSVSDRFNLCHRTAFLLPPRKQARARN